MLAHKPTAFRLRSWLVGACLSVAAASIAIAQSPPKNFIAHESPKPVPAIAFVDAQGRAQSLADFRGKVVLLNIWATWCSPCRREMPALDRLQATLGGPEFEVVALSIDRSGIEAVRKFYAEVGVRNLALHIDSSGKAPRELGAIGLPGHGSHRSPRPRDRTAYGAGRMGRTRGRRIPQASGRAEGKCG